MAASIFQTTPRRPGCIPVSYTHLDVYKRQVYAYILRKGQTRRYSDDGEPQGTAGVPVLEVLQREGLVDVAAVVTRYFGGVLLRCV